MEQPIEQRYNNNVLQAGVSDEDLLHVFRLGKRDMSAVTPKPLLIQLASYAQKKLIMECRPAFCGGRLWIR